MIKFRFVWKLFRERGFIGLSDELERNSIVFDINLICRDCYLMNENFFRVCVKFI